MSRLLRRTRIVGLACLLSCFLGSAAQAKARVQGPAAPRALAGGLASGFLEMGRAMLAALGVPLGNGCKMDPSGECIQAAPNNGCQMDPSGQCIKANLDNGCWIDPSGQCAKANLDNGCQLDPDGRPLPQSCSSLLR